MRSEGIEMTGAMKVFVLDSAHCASPASLRTVGQALELRMKLAVPDVLCARELHPCAEERLRRLGLRVEALASIEGALTLYRRHPALSLMDAFALTLAATHAWGLLTEEPGLETIARELRVPVRDHRWLALEIATRRSAGFGTPAEVRPRGIGYPSGAYAAY